MAYRMAPVLVTLNGLEGHSLVAGLFKCNWSNICAAFYQISADSMLTDSWASCCLVLMQNLSGLVICLSGGVHDVH